MEEVDDFFWKTLHTICIHIILQKYNSNIRIVYKYISSCSKSSLT